MMTNYIIKTKFTPLPSNISYWWNMGSLLGLCLSIQILSGIFLSLMYNNDASHSFDSIIHTMNNINMGWLIRFIHANGASMFFLTMYLHIGRNIYFKSYNLKYVWISGFMSLLTLFATSFLGYVLPWGQMSYWGATVITNLMSSIPYAGETLTMWVWGSYSVSKPTLSRFFSIHFILPFILLLLSSIHIIFLHNKQSSNPLGISHYDKIPFHPFFSWKDIFGIFITLTMLMTLCTTYPYIFMDPDNFTEANPLNTPPHIQPEWYFLFAYSILRVIPNKLGGVLALLSSIFILAILPLIQYNPVMNPAIYKTLFKYSFFMWSWNFILLTMLGSAPIEPPFSNLSIISGTLYFVFFMLL
uniref:Cytochrome b n=1 Tax=Blattisocius tarsalis TaxID=1609195 RepID=A0A6B9WEL4_9ACAR|nr:cytochrome b [Blattisocius tarsalis]QHQ98568.1 cytochrome b [Blattisocius tarsalis]